VVVFYGRAAAHVTVSASGVLARHPRGKREGFGFGLGLGLGFGLGFGLGSGFGLGFGEQFSLSPATRGRGAG
jgi:hypothetical protein